MSILTSIKSAILNVKNNYTKGKQFKNIIANIGNEIVNSDDYKANDIKKCFDDRLIHNSRKDSIDRIIAAYNKAKAVQKNLGAAYQVGNEWLPIYNNHMKDIMAALSVSDADRTNKIYENFMREDCSVGLHGLPVNMRTTYFGGDIAKIDEEIYLHDAIYRYHHWKKLTDGKYLPVDLNMPDYGNPYGYWIDNQFIRTGAEYLHYYAERIAELISDEKGRKVVVELGGGYGGLGYFLNKNITNITYVDFDLPENMALTAFYLMSAFPKKKVLLYGEADLSEETIYEYDIIIMPNFEIAKLPSDKINLAFNSYSLAEMSTETINTYIPELQRASKKYIYHINHTKMSHSLKADEFGIENNNYHLVYKKMALWNMGRNIQMDEGEYLYLKQS